MPIEPPRGARISVKPAPNKTAPPSGLGLDLFDPTAITADSKPLPDRICLYAPPKWGKSAWAAEAPGPVFLCTRGEDGIQVLKKTGVVSPEVRAFPRCAETWAELLRAFDGLIKRGPPPQTLVLDTLNGAEAMCHAHVCQTVYGGDWGEKGFSSFQVGYRTTSPKEFERLLDLIDALREKGTQIICLCHTAVATRKNPHGPDYDVNMPALHNETWKVASRRFDVLLFGTFEVSVSKASARDRKGKATGNDRRVIYARPGAAHEAGGRYNLPEEIDGGTSAAECWANFQAALNPDGECES